MNDNLTFVLLQQSDSLLFNIGLPDPGQVVLINALTFDSYMKIFFTSFLFIAFGASLSAQEFNTSLTEVSSLNIFGKSSVIVGNRLLIYDFTTNLRGTKLKYELKLFSLENTQLLKEYKYDKDSIHMSSCIEQFKKIDGKVYFIYESGATYNESGNIVVAEIDTSTLVPGKPKIIAHLARSGIELGGYDRYLDHFKVKFIESPDKKYLLFFLSINGGRGFYYSVLDTDFRIIHEQTVKPLRDEESGTFFDAAIDNNLSVYAGYRIYPGKKTSPERNAGFITVIDKNRQQSEIMIDLGEAKLSDVKIIPSSLGPGVKICGLYTENGVPMHTGVFYTEMKADFKINGIRKTPFPDKLVEQLQDEGWARTRKNRYGIEEQISFESVEYDNGNIGLIGEFRRRDVTDKGSVFDHSGSLLNINFSENEPTFYRVSKHRISGGTTAGDSYQAYKYHNNLVIFYNDDKTNIKREMSSFPLKSNFYDDVALAVVIIKPGFGASRNALIDMAKENFMALTGKIVTDSQGALWVPFYKVKGSGKITDEFRWGKIVVK